MTQSTVTPSMDSRRGLMGARFFAPLFWAQACGAFSDNFFKQVLLLLLTYVAVPAYGWDIGIVNNVAAGLFIVPLLLFSGWGGTLADAIDKRTLIRAIKWLELITMSVAALLIWYQAFVGLLLLLFLAGTQAALFGPVKYAILPQQVPRRKLVVANAWVELATFLAILLGIVLAGVLVSLSGWWASVSVSLVLIGVSAAGVVAAYFVPSAPPVEGHKVAIAPVRQSVEVLRTAWQQRRIFNTILGISTFWFLGVSYLTQLPQWVATVVHGSGSVVSFLLAAFAVGIGLGSLLCARLSAGRMELGLIPLGALLIGLAGLDFAYHPAFSDSAQLHSLAELLFSWRLWWMFVDLALIGVGGGLLIIPLYMRLQTSGNDAHRSRIIAANNIINALFMVISALGAAFLLGVLGISLHLYFGLVAALSLSLGILLAVKYPRPVLRICIFIVLRLCYRLKLSGRHNIPDTGPALVMCNHVSYMDALLLGGTSPRLLRFMMDTPAYESPWLNWFCRIAGAIPVDLGKRNPKDLRRALNEVSAALRNGEVVMIFPEGRLTRDGNIAEFRRGVETILKRDPVPVIPAAISGLWGSWGSYRRGRPFKRWPTRFRRKVRLGFGASVPYTQWNDRRVLRDRVLQVKEELGGGK
ncbi:Lysophospholipid transporter LplT [Carnimonas sp. R-84981]|uniref:MFS transporter n=1 Tax=Carnimonas bestiolae TaxID=3402172 RepID=UPI003EDC1B37